MMTNLLSDVPEKTPRKIFGYLKNVNEKQNISLKNFVFLLAFLLASKKSLYF